MFLILPFLSFLTVLLFGRYFGRQGSIIIILSEAFLSFLIALNLFFVLITKQESALIFSLGDWIHIFDMKVTFSLLVDPFSIAMICLILFITGLVKSYSVAYMSHDPYQSVFLAYLSFFAFAMLLFVSASNLLLAFVGWEFVGLASFLLINFWSTRRDATTAGLKAIILNRVGDSFFLLALALIFYVFNSFSYSILFNVLPFVNLLKINLFFIEFHAITLIMACLLVAAIAKSAQILLHTWLPDAMEGPTPVSSLLHSATMVTAGIFLILRLHPLLLNSSIYLFISISLFGFFTILVSSFIGMFQYDIKRIIAFSTAAQLGYMMASLGSLNFVGAFFHLFNHAFFKCLLFLCAGIVIHSFVSGEQDIRKMGGLINFFPLTYCAFFIASLSLCGLPFLSGYYSKDFIIEAAFSGDIFSQVFAAFALISVFFTAFYSTRLLILSFFSLPKFHKKAPKDFQEANWPMIVPVFFLTLASIFTGYFCRHYFLESFVPKVLWVKAFFLHDEFLNNYFLTLSPLFFSIAGFILACLLPLYDRFFGKISYFVFVIYAHFAKKFSFDAFYNKSFVLFFGDFATLLYKNVDRGSLEDIGPGASRFVSLSVFANFFNGIVYQLFVFGLLSLAFFALYLIFPFNGVLFVLAGLLIKGFNYNK